MHFEIDLSSIKKLIPEIKKELAAEGVKYIKEKIKRGVNPPLKHPRSDGSIRTPLYKTGAHLYKSIDSSIDNKGVSIGTTFVPAIWLHKKRPFLEPDNKIMDIFEGVWKRHSYEG